MPSTYHIQKVYKFKIQDKYAERLPRNQRQVDTTLLMNDYVHKHSQTLVCVCVCERERERERS
jgi:hypothetical protein